MSGLKDRLDAVLVKRGFFSERNKAAAAIMAGLVIVDGIRIDKAGTGVYQNAVIEVKEGKCPYVSRGGIEAGKGIGYLLHRSEGYCCH